MNRAVFLSIPDLDDEIELTGKEIQKSYNIESEDFNKLVEKLCKTNAIYFMYGVPLLLMVELH